MIVFEHVVICQSHIAERTSLMPINGFEDASLTVDVATTSNITVLDVVKADIAQQLFLQCLDVNSEIMFLSHSD